jgi:5-methylcytosine-specific restriction endonuclease McrA
MAWRTDPLPRGWERIRARILIRDGGRCTVTLQDGTRCTAPATDVDHINGHADHSDANLRAICGWHHRRKTSAQANKARKRVTQRYPSEKHPGAA